MVDRIEHKQQTQLVATAPKSCRKNQDSITTPPVFVYSSFRTGSTWLWSKLRQAPSALAYYEIFHEALPHMTPGQARNDSQSWDSGHPITAAYFLEFIPFLCEPGGLSNLHRPSPMSHCFPEGGPDGDLSCADEIYVNRLIKAAQCRHLQPVLTCTRALGRARALRRAFGGTAIFLHRNLFHQWASYSAQMDAGNPYFINTIFQTIEAAPQDMYLQAIAQWYDLAAHTIPREALFEVFLLIHLYMYSIAYDAADVVMDMSHIGRHKDARQQAERQVSELLRFPIDLSDARETFGNPAISIALLSKTQDTLQQFMKLIPTENVSIEGMAFIRDALDAALEEWDRYELLTKRTVSILETKISRADASTLELTDALIIANSRVKQLEDQLAAAAANNVEQIRLNEEEFERLNGFVEGLIEEKRHLSENLQIERSKNISMHDENQHLLLNYESACQNLAGLQWQIAEQERKAAVAESQLEAFLRFKSNRHLQSEAERPPVKLLSRTCLFIRRNLIRKQRGHIDEPGDYVCGSFIRCSGWIVSPRPIGSAWLTAGSLSSKLDLYERKDVSKRYPFQNSAGWDHVIDPGKQSDTIISIKLFLDGEEICSKEFAWAS